MADSMSGQLFLRGLLYPGEGSCKGHRQQRWGVEPPSVQVTTTCTAHKQT